MPVRALARLLLAVILSVSIDVKAQQPPPQSAEPLTVEALAAKLVDEPDADARDALLTTHAGLVGAPLATTLMNTLGREARNAGQIERARRAYETAGEVAVRANAPTLHALSLNNIGLLAYDQGDYQDALDWYAKSLAISEQNGDEQGQARTLNNMGAAYSFGNALDSARAPLERSLEIGTRLKNPRLISNALNNLAILDGMRGDYARALGVLQRSYDIEAPGGSLRNLTITRLNIGNLYFNQGDDTQAAQQFEQALGMADKSGVRQLSGIAMMGLGNVAQLRGDLAEAVRQFERCLVIFREINDKPNISNTLSVLASVLAESGQYDRALELLRESMELQRAIGGGGDLARILTRVAAMHNGMKQYRDALAAAEQAVTVAAPTDLREALWRGHLEAARAFAGLGDAAKAEARFSRAIAVIEDLRDHVAGGELQQPSFFENKLAPYHELIGLLVAQKRDDEAFACAERARSRVLVDVFRSGRRPEGSLSADEAAKDEQFQIRLASLNARVLREQSGANSSTDATASSANSSASNSTNNTANSSTSGASRGGGAPRSSLAAERDAVRLEYEAFRTALYAQHSRLKLEHGETKALTIAEALALSRQRQSAIVEFVVTEATTYAFLLDGARTGARVQAFALPIARKTLAARVNALVDQITNRDVAFRTGAIDLHRILLDEVTRGLRPGRALIVVPDGVLWQLPFQALMTSNGSYLIYERELTYAPSASALKLMTSVKQSRHQRSAARATRLLAFGNPAWNAAPASASTLRDTAFTSLPHAEDEVKRLGHLYGDARSLVRIGADAAEARFKAEAANADVLHLATHGVLNDVSPLYSYLLFASTSEGDRNDGLLEARELLRLDLRASLAVLSACDTARGRVAAGEGVVGFSWALFLAGVPTVVVSQWKVDSASTSELMVEFHRRRRAGLSDARAMQAAVRALRGNPAYRHPFFWAPFIVVGAG